MPGSKTIKTSYSSHKSCFICKRSRERLFGVDDESIHYAFKNHRIIIKKDARVCGRHLDLKKKIKKEHFVLIPTHLQSYDSSIVVLLDSLSTFSTDNCGLFDKFRNADFLDEHHFKITTGLSKKHFMMLSRFITSINDTNGRTKEELLSIYLYWVRKGIDQCSLAMFKNNCNQQQISHYLQQIRIALNKDFVPFFLGE